MANFQGVTNLPLKKNLVLEIRTDPRIGMEIPFLRSFSLSHVASASVWLLRCTRQNLTAVLLACQVAIFKILIGLSWYCKSSCRSITSMGVCSSGTLKHCFSCDTWNTLCMSDISRAILGGRLLFQFFPKFYTVQYIAALIFLRPETFECL